MRVWKQGDNTGRDNMSPSPWSDASNGVFPGHLCSPTHLLPDVCQVGELLRKNVKTCKRFGAGHKRVRD